MKCHVATYSSEINEELLTHDCVCFPYSGNAQEILIPQGEWKFELWGAAGGIYIESIPAGLGAYVRGVIKLSESITLFGYVGGRGGNYEYGHAGTAGFNGGCEGGDDDVDFNSHSPGSGGATDLRLYKDDMYSRIIVAGGGGSPGCYLYSGKGGSGGTVYGIPGESNKYGTMSGGKGGDGEDLALFGKGQKGHNGIEADGSGGGGYFGGYGGSAGKVADQCAGGGGGGSSYVSGYEKCKTFFKDNTLHGPEHYSGYTFHYIEMYSGIDTIIESHVDGISYEPHFSDGLIRISRFTNFKCVSCLSQRRFLNLKHFVYILILIK